MNNNIEEAKFSPAFLLEMWAIENNKYVKIGRADGKTKNERAKNQAKKAKVENGRNYKGQSGHISKDGKHGYFDVDERGRYICV